jgi:hypothetical protein
MVDLNSIDQAHFWYFVGLLVTDGNLSKDNRHINITSKDVDHLVKVNQALGLDNKITMKSRGASLAEKKYGFLQFSDVRLYKYLLSLGVTPNKSLTLGPLKVPAVYFPDFLRGVIDGDGSIRRWMHASNLNEQWSLSVVSASHRFIVWLHGVICKQFGVQGRLHESNRGMYLLKFGKLKAQVIIQSCYYDGCLALDRKMHQALQCIKPNTRIRNYIARVV